MTRSVIVCAVRTPFGRLGGGLAKLEATELGSLAIRAGLDRAGVENDEVEYVIMGQVLQAGAGQAPARQAAIGAGLPKEMPADTINKVCASSIRAVQIADADDPRRRPRRDRDRRDGVDVERAVPAEEGALRLPARQRRADRPHGLRRAHVELRLAAHGAAGVAWSPASSESRREEQDAWAYRSHQRAVAAQDEGRFDDEIVPVGDVTADEAIRAATRRSSRSRS